MASSVSNNFSSGSVGDFLKEHIQPGADLSFVSAYFNYYAYDKLKGSLDQINNLRFLFGVIKIFPRVSCPCSIHCIPTKKCRKIMEHRRRRSTDGSLL